MNVNFESIEKAWFKPKKTVLDELEEWLKEEYNFYDKYGTAPIGYAMGQIKRTLDKIQELKKEMK